VAAGSKLLMLGINQRAVMGLMGWSNNAVTTRYQHVEEQIRAAVSVS
jgi:integrase